MSSAIQNRLVGTIILVALAVIFLPDILDGQKQSNRDLFVDLPQRPAMMAVKEAQPFPRQEVLDKSQRQVEIVEDIALDDPPQPAPKEDPQVSQNDADLAAKTVIDNNEKKLMESAGWVVQLGVFRHQKNVQELLQKLDSAGYRGFSQQVKTSSGQLTKVYVGPDVDRQKLQSALPHLKQVTNLQGRLTPFKVK